MAPLLSVADAQAILLRDVAPMVAETMRLAEAAGRTLAAPLVARRTQPPVAVSRMDGYAVRQADAAAPGATLHLVGTSAAGHAFDGSMGAGETVRIFTGAALPAGADAVLIQEDAEASGDTIVARVAVSPAEHVRRAGLDFSDGDALLAAGTELDYRQLSLAAAMGHGELPVRRRPRVAIIATGDELVPAGSPAGDTQVVASSGYGVAALVAAAGGEPHDLGIVPDDLAALRERLRIGLESADVVIVLGGASVGDHDLTRPAFEAEGVEPGFWKIAMRPGKPLVFGRRGAVRLLGLPGNAVSSLVCGILFVQPLIRALLGQPYPLPRFEAARLAAPLPANDGREDYLRATLEDDPAGLPWVSAFPRQDSSMLAPLAAADCLLVRAVQATPASRDDICRIIRL
jgi:molybdopterin molybdotransferase